MRYDLFLTWRNIIAKPVQAVVPMVIVALAVALSIAVLALGAGVREGIIESSDPFGVLVVGPNGDGQQLVLNTILLQGNSLGTIPYEFYEYLQDDPRVRFAVPMAKGDNIGGFPIIGVNENFYELRRDQVSGPAFEVVAGERFDAPFEAVLGSDAARELGFTVGDT
ncbi:MAG: ABC transporter permease, partial [Chloroflexota bacterium]